MIRTGAVLILALLALLWVSIDAYKDARAWEAFKAEHDCKKVRSWKDAGIGNEHEIWKCANGAEVMR